MKKNILIISSYVLLVALLFSGAYVAGRTTIGGNKKSEKPVQREDIIEAVSENIAQSPEYEVIAEDGKIIIYKCIGEIKSVVTSEKISEAVFPKEDMEELRNGVKFERLENAQQLFENFVS